MEASVLITVNVHLKVLMTMQCFIRKSFKGGGGAKF